MRKTCLAVLLVFALLLASCGRAAETAEPVLSAPPTISSGQTQPANRIVRVSVTQLLGDSPLLQALCDRFEQQSAYRIELSVNPDNVAVSVAETGKMDLLIARTGTEASRFLAAGYGARSFDYITDTLVLAGPAADPAAVAEAQTVEQAFLRIAKTRSAFVSCYDDSDVNRIETYYWGQAGVIIGNGKAWYKAARRAQPGAIQMAQTLGAYILCTYEAYLQNADPGSLTLLLRDLPQMRNTYTVIPVSSAMFENVNAEGADAFCAFLRSESAQQTILSYGTDSYGSPIYSILN